MSGRKTPSAEDRERIRLECERNQVYQDDHAGDLGAHLLARRGWRKAAQAEALASGDFDHESLLYPDYEDIY